MYGATSEVLVHRAIRPGTEPILKGSQVRCVDEPPGKGWRMASNGYVSTFASPLFWPHRDDVGHYARKGWKTPPGSSIPRPQLLRSSDPTKDQNYYLSAIPEEGLERALFPLGELTKAEVRKIAEEARLPTAKRSESMGICFVGQKRKFSEFLGECSSALPPTPPPSCHVPACRGVSGTKSRSDIRPQNRKNPRDSQWIMDADDWPGSWNTRIKGAALRGFEEQSRERNLRCERLVRPFTSFTHPA